MAFADLDLEFEDEEDSNKKKAEAIQASVAIPRPTPPVVKAAAPVQSTDATANISRPAISKPLEIKPVVKMAPPAMAESPDDVESLMAKELKEQMRKIQLEAEVKVALAEFKTSYLTDMLSDMKMVEHQIGQLLIRINAKNPELKNEMLMIKKILADFIAKKRK